MNPPWSNLEKEFEYYAKLLEWVEVIESLTHSNTKKLISMSDLVSLVEGMGLTLLAKGEIYKFLTTVFGESSERISEVINNEVRCFNAQRTAESFRKAYETLKKAGIDPKRVSTKALLPILDGISLEEDSTLQEQWDALLTAAVAGTEIHPSYSQIISGLTPIDAKAVKALYQLEKSLHQKPGELESGCKRKKLAEILSTTFSEVEVIIDNLIRLRVARSVYIPPMTYPMEPIALFDNSPIVLTDLGMRFAKVVEGDSLEATS